MSLNDVMFVLVSVSVIMSLILTLYHLSSDFADVTCPLHHVCVYVCVCVHVVYVV